MQNGILDFARWNGSFAPCICYARLILESKEDVDLAMGLRLDAYGKLWVNGEEVELIRGNDTMKVISEPILLTAHLKHGENEILIKVHPGTLGHAFALNIAK